MAERSIRVWDLPLRLFHWSLVLLMMVLFVTAELMDDAMESHALAGYAVLVLVLFRLVWGFCGSTYARFSEFVRGPAVVLRYAGTLFHARREFMPGHNPLGGWMVLVLLAGLLVQAVLGLFSNDDVLFDGPLRHWVSKATSDRLAGLHHELFEALLVLVMLHVAALLFHKWYKGEDLVPAMFTGRKRLPERSPVQEARGGHPLLALAILAVCAGAVGWLVS